MGDVPTPSYWHSPRTTPFLYTTLGQMLDVRTKEQPDLEAYVVRRRNEPREAITFRDLADRSKLLARALQQLGIRKNDRIIITGISCINWFVATFACLRLGAHLMKCRTSLLTKEGLESMVMKNYVKALIYHPGIENGFENLLKTNFPKIFTNKGQSLPSLKHLITMSTSNYDTIQSVDNLLKDNTPEELTSQVDPDDIALIYMTSGSTGDAKAVPLTHFALVNSYKDMDLPFAGPKRYFNDRALSWVASDMYVPIMTPGVTMVYVQPLTAATNQDFDYSLQVMREERCTMAMLLQYMLHDMLERFEGGQEEPVQLELGFSGGEILHYELFKRASAFVKRWSFGYGSTEAMCVATNNRDDDLAKQLQYAGKIYLGVEMKIVDLAGNVVGLGEQGEICIRSQLAFRGYLDPDTVGTRIDRHGWLHLDDGGIMTRDGYIQVLGRLSAVISRGITITYPQVVEGLLLQCPGVDQAAVVGVPDLRLGQEIAAFVVPKRAEVRGVLEGRPGKEGAREKEDGGRETEDVGREREDGGRERGDGGRETEDGGRENEDGEREKEDGGKEKEDVGRETEDGGREKEDGWREKEDGGREMEDGEREKVDGGRPREEGETPGNNGETGEEEQTLTEQKLRDYFRNLYTTDEGLGVTPGYFFLVDTLPLNANGKVDVLALKELGTKLAEKKSSA